MSFEQQMQQAMRSFIVEAQELLEGMEHGLMELDPLHADPAAQDDGERINALFRAAHTIKGSAGLFGLDGIVRFTHHLESVLDQMRAGKLAVSPELVALLLQGRDHLAQLIDQVDSHGACVSDTPQEQALVAQLQAAQQPGGSALVQRLLPGQHHAPAQTLRILPMRGDGRTQALALLPACSSGSSHGCGLFPACLGSHTHRLGLLPMRGGRDRHRFRLLPLSLQLSTHPTPADIRVPQQAHAADETRQIGIQTHACTDAQRERTQAR